MTFLQELKDSGKGYSVINTARSALSSVILLDSNVTFGSLNLVKQFMRGVYNLVPPQPRYVEVWDPTEVLQILKSWSPAKKIGIPKLSMKIAVLILLVTGQRGQILTALNVEKMDIDATRVKFEIQNKDVKQGRLGYVVEPIILRAYPPDRRLCIYTYLKVYLKRTLHRRGAEKSLFLTVTKPYKRASRDALSRWVKIVLSKAGVDMTKFGPGSTRAASVSKARSRGVTVDEILKKGGWTRESTFQKFYHKKLVKEVQFDKAVLS